MKKSSVLLSGLVLAATAVVTPALAQVDLSDPAGTYATINAAVAAANPGATITVDGNSYNGTTENVVINVAGITLQGTNGAIVTNPGDGSGASGTVNVASAVIIASASNVTVQDLTVHVDEPEASGGIVFRGTVAALGDVTILNNTVTTNGPNASSDPHTNFPSDGNDLVPFPLAGYGSAVGISVLMSGGAGSVPCTIQGNTVGSEANPFSLMGISMERAHGQVGGTGGEGNVVYSENFAFINRFTQSATTIEGNSFYGWGDERNRGAVVELGDVQTGGDVVFDNNLLETLHGTQRSPQGMIPRRLMQIKNCYNSVEILLTNNTFNVYRDDTVTATEGVSGIGLAITNVRRAFVGGNTFNALEDDCILLEVNNKIYSSAPPFQNPGNETNRPRIYGNSFNASGTTGVTAISFKDHSQENQNGSGSKIEVEDIVCGNSADPNQFGADLGTFIELSDRSGSTSTHLDIYGNQSGESALSVTTAIPFAKNFFASENQFDVGSGLQFPFQMDGAGITAVEAKVQDYKDNAALGFVVISRSPDADNDDVPDAFEVVLGTDGTPSRDFDNDGIEDGVEIQIGNDPAVDEGATDTDGDGLPDSFDPTSYASGMEEPGGTNRDFDADGFADWYEVLFGTDPADPNQVPLLGDVDDAVAGVDFTDGIKMLRVFLGLEMLTALDNPALFDVNRDGINDNVDGVITINYFLGNIDTLPFGS